MKLKNLLFIGSGLLLGLGAGTILTTLNRQRRFSLFGRTVVITGGSRGLGLAMARELAKQGAHLALLARDSNELERAAHDLSAQGAVVATYPCDLRNPEQIEHVMGQIFERFGRIDVLINNAGIIQVGPLEHMRVEDFQECMKIHLFGPLYTTLAALPYMLRAKGGRIVNIASIGGKIAVPHLLPYTASKFALVGLSDGLRAELRRHHILVTTVCPGLMRTGSPPNAQFKGKYRNEYAWFAIGDSLPLISMDVQRAARKILLACRRGSPRLLVGVQTKAAVLFNEIFPGASAQLLAIFNKLLPKPDGTHDEIHSGWESQSRMAPSILTRLSDKATVTNNETPF